MEENILEVLKEGVEVARRFVVRDDRKGIGFSDSLLPKVLSVEKWEDLVLLNYRDAAQYMFTAKQWSPFLRVCRGIVFSKDGTLVSFPFHKFFNLGEVPENEVAKWEIKTVTEKVDGVLIQVFKWKDRLIWASRHRIWSQAAQHAIKICPDLAPIYEKIPFERWTLMMELICPEVRKVGMIDYGDMRALVLLAVRNLDTFELVNANEIFKPPFPDIFYLPQFFLPQLYNLSSVFEAREFVRSRRDARLEGVVLQGAGGLGNQLVKIKSPAYLDRVAAFRYINYNRVIKNYEEGGLEQVYNLLSGYEEVAREYEYDKLLKRIGDLETLVELEALSWREKPVEEIPVDFRWVKSYSPGSPKWEGAKRRIVISRLGGDKK